jgi:hypothetical protein
MLSGMKIWEVLKLLKADGRDSGEAPQVNRFLFSAIAVSLCLASSARAGVPSWGRGVRPFLVLRTRLTACGGDLLKMDENA